MAADQPAQPSKREDPIRAPEGITTLPTSWADTFFLTYNDATVKISFGEYIDGNEYWRTSIILPISDAEILSERIAEAVKEIKARKKPEK